MSNLDIPQALLNIMNSLKKDAELFGGHKISSDNVGIATIDGIGEVVYTRMPPDILNEEAVLLNDGKSENCSIINTNRPFTSAGPYRETLAGKTFIIINIGPIPDIEKIFAKLKLLTRQ